MAGEKADELADAAVLVGAANEVRGPFTRAMAKRLCVVVVAPRPTTV